MAAKKTATTKSPKASSASAPRSARRDSKRKREAGESLVTIDRRRSNQRSDATGGASDANGAAPAVPLERRKKVQRRRQIDPTTCERDYSIEEVEFMNAMDEYKRKSGRMFPTCSEVLEVIRDLGYLKLSPSERALLATEDSLVEQLEAVTATVDSLAAESL
jgi:hypothetical protein